ncbi:hypothetical protein VPH35_089823 [Triticum aestivum]
MLDGRPMCHLLLPSATSSKPVACRAKRAPAEELASSLTKATRRPLGRRGGRFVAPLDSGPHSPNKIPRATGEGREGDKGRAGRGEEKGANQGAEARRANQRRRRHTSSSTCRRHPTAALAARYESSSSPASSCGHGQIYFAQ